MSKCCKNGSIIGQLDKRIDIIQETSTRGDGGVRIATWSVLATRWAKITPKATNPLLESQNKENQINQKIKIRHDPSLALSTKNRIRFGTRFMFINNPYNLDENDEFDIIEATESAKAVVTVT